MHRLSSKDRAYLTEKYGYFYDLELKGFLEDLAFYQEHMPQNAKNVLELGCGTGRLTIALAKREYCVTGIDISQAMVKAAENRCRATAHRMRVHLACMDMTEFAFRQYFDAILIPYNTLNLLVDPKALRRCLRLSGQYLKHDSRIMMEVFTPDKKYFSLGRKRLLQFRTFQDSDETIVRKESSRGYDPETCLLDIHQTYRAYKKDRKAANETCHYRFQLTGLSRDRWEHILARSGFTMEAVYGDDALSPYVPGQSSRMLVMAGRTNRKVGEKATLIIDKRDRFSYGYGKTKGTLESLPKGGAHV